MMKKVYEGLKIKVCLFFTEDIITQSDPFVPDRDGDDNELPAVWI